MPKSAKRHQDPYRKRKCKLCKLEFSPTTKVIKNAEAQEFCCEAHRKEFWKYGALPFSKLMARIEKRCREIALEIVRNEVRLTLDAHREMIVNATIGTLRAQETLKEIRRDFPAGVS